MSTLSLTEPSLERLPDYLAALEAGWSPRTTRDVSHEQRAAIQADPAAFIADLRSHTAGTLAQPDGTVRERLPTWMFWLWDGGFCGVINLRHRPGTLALPPHVFGHVGYAVVPWRRRQGIATRALALLLPVAHRLGLPRVLVTCNESNLGSRRVIEASGGVFAGLEAPETDETEPKRLYWIETGA